MTCKNCGNELKTNSKFCAQCGYPNAPKVSTKISSTPDNLDRKWWLRLVKVIYIGLYIPLPFLLMLVWNENNTTYNFYTRTRTNTYGEAFWYSLLTFVIYIAILKLIKITFFYVTFGDKPQWKKEFKKFF